ncbi:MAG: glycosyltransferase family 9 protein [Betaproteobacteria bacterium]|nr:glycosyltransferase family 9 protein [Betaproteobacteria bacterium]
MSRGRFAARAATVSWAAWHTLARALRARRDPGAAPRRILIAHHLLLGDTLMLTALLKKLRLLHPRAEIVMTVPRALAPLYAGRPYGVETLPFDPREPSDLRALRAKRGFDLALLPAENRYSWLARAAASERIVAFEDPRAKPGNWLVTEWRRYPETPAAFGDIAATLVEGPPPPPYAPAEWPAPPCAPFERPSGAYCVLHLGASTMHKHWNPAHWRSLARWAEGRGFAVVLTSGPGAEAELVRQIDPEERYAAHPGTLDLAQLWALVAGAAFLVCPDTGVAHLGRIVGTPTVALFGPGSPVVSGPGEFWRASPFAAVWEEDIPCRDQDLLFGRPLAWVRQCWRGVDQCGNPVCMHVLGVERVLEALERLLGA